MIIVGVPKEIKNHEDRIGLIPKAVETLTKNGHSVSIESGAGIGAGFSDDDFKKAGALITNNLFIWLSSDIIIKVKEPLVEEMEGYSKLMVDWPHKKHSENDLIMFAFFHFNANPLVKKFVLENKIKAIPYENIQLPDGSRPVLAAMSKIAAEVAVSAADRYLRKENGGKGILLKDASAIVIGGKGSLGKTALRLLIERGSRVIGFDKNAELIPFNSVFMEFGSGLLERKIASAEERLKKILPFTDIVICAAAQKGEGAPKIITREMLKMMQPGSVIVDPSIDEGGCAETSRPTTHDNPVFVEEGIIHYCVSNMPGAVPHSSTPALVKETLPYILEVANKGWEKALKDNSVLARAAKID